MKKMVFALLLVVLLVSLALPAVAKAGCGYEDPCPPGQGHSNNENTICWSIAPPGLQGFDQHGKAGDNWIKPGDEPPGTIISTPPWEK